jgi:hypothetical protein
MPQRWDRSESSCRVETRHRKRKNDPTYRDLRQSSCIPSVAVENPSHKWEPVRCQRFVAAARREEGEYPRWIFDRRATPPQRQRSATLRAKLWPKSGCVAPQSQNASAMLLRRALPAARQSLAHRFPIDGMGSSSDLMPRRRNEVFYAVLAIALVLAAGLAMFWPLL